MGLVFPQIIMQQVIQSYDHSYSIAAVWEDRGSCMSVFGVPFTSALQSYLWLWYFHLIPFQACEWSVALSQLQLAGIDGVKVFVD